MIRSRFRTVFRRATLEREMHDEMNVHLDRAVERLVRRGLSEPEARAVVRREFGNVALLQEDGRDARGARWIESCAADIRFAVRHFARTPLTAITLILVLALGIGVNSAVFSVLQAFVLRAPPGVMLDESLVRVRGMALERTRGRLVPRAFSMPELSAIAEHNETFASVAGWVPDQMVLDKSDGSDPRMIRGHYVTPNYFSVLGARTTIGPGLPAVRTDDAPGAELAVVLAHSVWETLGADTAMVGRPIRINGIPVRVVGIAQPGFQGPFAGPDHGAYVWIPLEARVTLVRSSVHSLTSRDSTLLQAVARLTPNTTSEKAASVARLVAATWAPADTNRRGEPVDYSTNVMGLSTAEELGTEYVLGFSLAGIAAILILLITCTSVSALLVGAGVARRREFAIRLSLGASRQRLVRQLITESSLIALSGGALGLAAYSAIIRFLQWNYGEVGFGSDMGTVGFTALIALGTGVIFGLSPALNATRLDVSSALKGAGGGATSRSRLQRVFIVAQISLTQPLLIGLALVMGIARTEFGVVHRDDPDASRVSRISFNAGDSNIGPPNAKHLRIQAVMDRVAELPGVERVMPQSFSYNVGDFRVPSADRTTGRQAGEIVRARIEAAPPGYLAFRSIPLVRGRDVIPADTIGPEMPIVIGSDLARAFWGTADPIGMRLEIVQQGRAVVVGVFDTTTIPAPPGTRPVYTAHGRHWRKDTYLIRTRGPGTAMIPTIRKMVREEIPEIPFHDIKTLQQSAEEDRRAVMMVSGSAAGGGLLALLLASIGLYGVVALAVRQQHREIGIRAALGARPQQVVAMFFVSGLRLSLIGILLGLPLTVGVLHFLLSRVAGRYLASAWLLGGGVIVAVSVIAVASLATWIPARRAAGVDPLVAIGAE